MDENIKILLNKKSNVNAVDVDMYNKIELSNKLSLLTEYNINNILSATKVFDIERQTNSTYRIYGKIEYLSLLNGLKLRYDEFELFSCLS